MLRYGRTTPQSHAGRQEQEARVRELLVALGDRELIRSAIAARLEWSDWMTGAVLDAGIGLGKITRRLETDDERARRIEAAKRTQRGVPAQRKCWVYKAAVAVQDDRKRVRQPPRMIFRPLPGE